MQSKIYEKNDLFLYSLRNNKWTLCEMESITKQPDEMFSSAAKSHGKDITKIFINNNNFNIFSKHVKNFISLSPIKKTHSHHSLFVEKKDNNKFLSAEYNSNNNSNATPAKQKNLSMFNRKENNFDASPSARKLIDSQRKFGKYRKNIDFITFFIKKL